jgi:hypothetical protein
MFIPRLLPAVALLALAAAAQTVCPHKQVRHVDAAWFLGPTVNCGGVEITAGAGSYRTSAQGCPLSAVFVPPHDLEEATAADTLVEVVGQVPMEIFNYTCQSSYFLIFKIGSDCTPAGHQVGATLPLMRTIGCGTTRAEG